MPLPAQGDRYPLLPGGGDKVASHDAWPPKWAPKMSMSTHPRPRGWDPPPTPGMGWTRLSGLNNEVHHPIINGAQMFPGFDMHGELAILHLPQ